MSRQRNTRVLWASVAAAAASFMPWVTLTSIFGTLSVSGMEGDGQLSLILALAVAALAYTGKLRAAQVGAWLGVAFGAFEYANLQSHVAKANTDVGHAAIGAGVYVLVFGFLAAAVFTGKAIKARRTPFAPPAVTVA